MNCPKCGGILEEHGGRIQRPKPFAKNKSRESQIRQYFHCSTCNKNFVFSYALVEVNVVSRYFKGA